MGQIVDLSDLYSNVLLGPRRGRDVCVDCFNLTDGHDRCFACTRSPRCLTAMSAISYSVSGGQLHHALAGYKRLPPPAAQEMATALAAVLGRYLEAHEGCLAAAAGVDRFPLVTSVPPTHGGQRALEFMLTSLVLPARDRYRPMLELDHPDVPPHQFSPRRYRIRERLAREPVLLIDDTWTTGANAQSAAAALTEAGAGPVAGLVIGRFVNRRWHRNDARLRTLPRPFDWTRCCLCATTAEAAA